MKFMGCIIDLICNLSNVSVRPPPALVPRSPPVPTRPTCPTRPTLCHTSRSKSFDCSPPGALHSPSFFSLFLFPLFPLATSLALPRVNKRDLAAIFNHGWLGSHASPCRTLNQTVGARSIFFLAQRNISISISTPRRQAKKPSQMLFPLQGLSYLYQCDDQSS